MRRAFSPSPLTTLDMTKELDLIELFAPQEILQDFDFEKLVDESGIYRIYMVEKDDADHIPAELKKEVNGDLSNIVLDGYTNYIELQTFPPMGKEVFLYLKRRRWKIKQGQRQEQKSYTNSYSYNEKGMKATKAFGIFFKEIDWVYTHQHRASRLLSRDEFKETLSLVQRCLERIQSPWTPTPFAEDWSLTISKQVFY